MTYNTLIIIYDETGVQLAFEAAIKLSRNLLQDIGNELLTACFRARIFSSCSWARK